MAVRKLTAKIIPWWGLILIFVLWLGHFLNEFVLVGKADGLNITARQYGEVVLPDAASGNCPGTRRQASHITITVQGGYGALFAVRVQILSSITSVAVQG